MPDAMRKSLGERLKAARLEAGMSQEDACELMGISRQAISAWERGLRPVPVGQLVQFAITYVCCAHRMLFGESFQDGRLRQLSQMSQAPLPPPPSFLAPSVKRVRRKKAGPAIRVIQPAAGQG